MLVICYTVMQSIAWILQNVLSSILKARDMKRRSRKPRAEHTTKNTLVSKYKTAEPGRQIPGAVEGDMYKNYAVVYQNMETKRVNSDTFYSRSAAEARHDFSECYRHGNYRILVVVEIPEE